MDVGIIGFQYLAEEQNLNGTNNRVEMKAAGYVCLRQSYLLK